MRHTGTDINTVKVRPVSVRLRNMQHKPSGNIVLRGVQWTFIEVLRTQFGYTDAKAVGEFLEHADQLITHRGKVDACKRLQAYFMYAKAAACGYPAIVTQSSWVATDSDGCPKALKRVKGVLFSGTLDQKRAVLTLLSVFRLLHSKPMIDVSTIVQPSKFDGLARRENRAVKHATDLLVGRNDGDAPRDTWLHISSKKGPNGPWLDGVVKDALALASNEKLLGAIKTLYAWTESSDLKSDIRIGEDLFQGPIADRIDNKVTADRVTRRSDALNEALKAAEAIDVGKRTPVTGRLAALSAGACKTRIVAICDWFTQDALKPTHEWAFRLLRKIRQDGTFSHNRVAQRAKLLSGAGAQAWCFDLSAATDRFPALLQRGVIASILGETIADAWYTVITSRSFASSEGEIVYQVGQPMGALSSWPVFALSHHMIVQAAAKLARPRRTGWFASYVLIGDDLAIFTRDVADAYIELLTKLDVPVNMAKSLTPDPASGVSAVEIAKRTFISGEELSPIPPDLILAAKGDPRVFPQLFQVMVERGIRRVEDCDPVQSLLHAWYTPRVVQDVNLVLFSPLDSKAPRLIDGGDLSLNPWAGISVADIETEISYVLLRRIADKATNIGNRLAKLAGIPGVGATSGGDGSTPQPPVEPLDQEIGLAAQHTGLPIEILAVRLLNLANSVSELQSQGDFYSYAMDLQDVDFALDALDAYKKRRQSHQRLIAVARILKQVHKSCLDLKDLGFDDDGDFDDFELL